MAGSNASSNATSRHGDLPVCGCGDPMRLWISNTVENPRRKFWKCVNWGRKTTSCKLFVWVDELDFERWPMVTATGPHSNCENPKAVEAATASTSKTSQCKCCDVFKDWESRKITKLKLKLLNEKKKMKWMQRILRLVILYLAYQKSWLV